MKSWTKRLLMGLGLAGAGNALALGFGTARWKGKTLGMVKRLNAAALPSEPDTVSFKGFDTLPAPVARYLRSVLKEGQPLIRTARVRQQGEFWMKGKWIPFTAQQYFSAAPPGMVWDADMRMNPWLNVRVRDAYLAGQGSMQGKLLALVPVLNEPSSAELNAGALQRHLAEAVWLPTALLPSGNLQWSVIDEHRALATLTDAGLSVSLEFRFNDADEVTSVYTPGRYYREAKGEYVLMPWAGDHGTYEEHDGMHIPIEGGVEWELATGRLPYCKLKVVGVEYKFAR